MNSPGRIFIPLVIVAAGVYFLFLVRGVLLPFFLAAALAYLLNPVIEFFAVHGVRRSPVVVGLYLTLMAGFLLLVYLGGAVLNHEAVKAARNMPRYIQTGQIVVAKARAWGHGERSGGLESPIIALISANSDWVSDALAKARTWPSAILQHMPSLASHVLPVFELCFLVPFIAFFLMMEGPALVNTFFQWMPARYVEMLLNVVVEIDNSLGRYLRALSIEALSAGLCALLGFWCIGLDYSVQIAMVMGIGGMIPYLGPVSGAIIGSAVAIFQWGSPVGVLKVLAVCAGVRFIEDWFLQPLILKRAVQLHPVLIVFSLMAGAALWGFWGLVFGVPVACTIQVTLPVLWTWYRSEYGLLGERAPAEISHIPVI